MSLELELDQIFNKELAVPLIYSRDDREISIDAIPTESLFELESTNGAFIRFRTKDFIVRQEDLDFGDGLSVPQRKDVVSMQVNGATKTFEVLSEPALQHFSETDAYGLCYTIHTKEKPS